MPSTALPRRTLLPARSVDLHRATFRIRSAFEQQLAGGDSSSAGGGGLTGLVGLPATTDQLYPAGSLSGARLGRPGHRRINRSRSANELDDMLRAAALGGDADLGGPAPWPGGERDIECVGSPWRADSATTAGTAADAATGGVGAGSRRGPGAAAEGRLGRLAALQRHPSPSAPALSALQLDGGGPAGLSTPPPAGGGMQMPSAPGSAPRRPWNVEAPAGLFPAFSQASHQDESEGPRAGSPAPVPREGGLPIRWAPLHARCPSPPTLALGCQRDKARPAFSPQSALTHLVALAWSPTLALARACPPHPRPPAATSSPPCP